MGKKTWETQLWIGREKKGKEKQKSQKRET